MNPDPPQPSPSRGALVIAWIAVLIQIGMVLQSRLASPYLPMAIALWALLTTLLTLVVWLSLCFSLAARKAKRDLGMLAAVFAICAISSGFLVMFIASV